VSETPPTSSSECGGRAATTWASRASTAFAAATRAGPLPATVPRSTIDSTQSANASAALAGSCGLYRSIRPNGRAAAIAAPGPTEVVQRIDSARAPGWAFQGRSWLRSMMRCRSSSDRNESARSSSSLAQSPSVRPPLNWA
jgi:hypothetical protein